MTIPDSSPSRLPEHLRHRLHQAPQDTSLTSYGRFFFLLFYRLIRFIHLFTSFSHPRHHQAWDHFYAKNNPSLVLFLWHYLWHGTPPALHLNEDFRVSLSFLSSQTLDEPLLLLPAECHRVLLLLSIRASLSSWLFFKQKIASDFPLDIEFQKLIIHSPSRSYFAPIHQLIDSAQQQHLLPDNSLYTISIPAQRQCCYPHLYIPLRTRLFSFFQSSPSLPVSKINQWKQQRPPQS